MTVTTIDVFSAVKVGPHEPRLEYLTVKFVIYAQRATCRVLRSGTTLIILGSVFLSVTTRYTT